jgi:hypothetical protein
MSSVGLMIDWCLIPCERQARGIGFERDSQTKDKRETRRDALEHDSQHIQKKIRQSQAEDDHLMRKHFRGHRVYVLRIPS